MIGYLDEVRATREILDEETALSVATAGSHGIVVGTGLPGDAVLVHWTWSRLAAVTSRDALARWRVAGGEGDVWGALIAELPEGAARDLADQRRERGLETHGVPLPLRTLAQSLADQREELGDAAAYGVAVAVHRLLAGDEDGAIVASYEAGRHLQQGSGIGDVRVGYAMWRAVRRLARGVR